ncbi:hypothetical protein KKF61_01835 [Patescibacteria group bacterium]|nr:hypothetical protein [Patescibacteria group bacterium]MBU0963755.1 hypothetical protein [Patescibacteria group bacterium]
MVGIINIFLPLIIQILILYSLSRIIDRLVIRRLGKGWYLATMWPGVMIHELAHFVACLITLTKVYKVRLFYPSGDSLGFVQHAKSHNPIKNIIISIAPLFGVTAVIWLLTKFLWPDLYVNQVSGIQAALTDFSSFKNFFAFSQDFFIQYVNYIKDLLSSLDFFSWQTYIFIYLMLTLSSHAAPSKADLKHTYYGILGLLVVFTLILMFDQWLQVPVTWTVVQWLAKPLFMAASFITYGIVFAMFSLILLLLISLVFRVFKRGVSY